MKKFRRFLRMMGLVLLILLASFGIGLTGAAPLTLNRKKREPVNQDDIELVEEEQESEYDEIKDVS